MKTLSRNYTKNIFTDKEAFAALESHWSVLMNDKEQRKQLNAAHHMIYNAIRGKNWQKGFVKAKNPDKVTRFADLLCSFLWYIHHDKHTDWLLKPFNNLLTASDLKVLAKHLPEFTLKGGENPLDFEPYKDLDVTLEQHVGVQMVEVA